MEKKRSLYGEKGVPVNQPKKTFLDKRKVFRENMANMHQSVRPARKKKAFGELTDRLIPVNNGKREEFRGKKSTSKRIEET